MQRRHGELNDSRSSDPSILCWQKNIFGFGEASFACWLMIMLLGVQVQVRVQGHLSPQIIYCYYFAGSVQSNHQYAKKWKENIRISPCISCSDLSTEVEHLDMWQKKIHISSQQTCSVLKSSTVALPVTFRSSEEKLLPSVSAETSWSWHRRHVRPLQN